MSYNNYGRELKEANVESYKPPTRGEYDVESDTAYVVSTSSRDIDSCCATTSTENIQNCWNCGTCGLAKTYSFKT